jgi:hypothetical protein
MIQIPLTRGLFALIDEDDALIIAQHKWTASVTTRGYAYASRRTGGRKCRQTIMMHRLLLSPDKHQFVDHINGDGLDNRRSNLRLATPSQNAVNTHTPVKGEVRFIGVRRNKSNFGAYGRTCDGRQVWLGTFKTPELAAAASDRLSLETFGQFARLNFSPVIDEISVKAATPERTA